MVLDSKLLTEVLTLKTKCKELERNEGDLRLENVSLRQKKTTSVWVIIIIVAINTQYLCLMLILLVIFDFSLFVMYFSYVSYIY